MAERIWGILPATNFPRPIKGCGNRWGEMAVVQGGGGVGSPIVGQHVDGPGWEDVVCVCHELGRSNVASGGEGDMENKGETG